MYTSTWICHVVYPVFRCALLVVSAPISQELSPDDDANDGGNDGDNDANKETRVELVLLH